MPDITADQARARVELAIQNRPEKERKHKEEIQRRAEMVAGALFQKVMKDIGAQADQGAVYLNIIVQTPGISEEEKVKLRAHEIVMEKLKGEPYGFNVTGYAGQQNSSMADSGWSGGQWFIGWHQ